MIAIMLMMIAGGIGLTQAVSHPQQVTLRWLRLGGINALALMAVAATVVVVTQQAYGPVFWVGWLLAFGLVWAQLIAVQRAQRQLQRIAGGLYFVAAWAVVVVVLQIVLIGQPWPHDPGATQLGARVATVGVSSGLVGGFLMAMLLGHAYLTAGGEMTQQPFRRLVLLLGGLLIARAVLSLLFGVWPYMQIEDWPRAGRMWNVMMMSARYLVGLAAPAVFTYMTYDCVQRRSNQSATGILYVASVLVLLGEGVALALWAATGLAF